MRPCYAVLRNLGKLQEAAFEAFVPLEQLLLSAHDIADLVSQQIGRFRDEIHRAHERAEGSSDRIQQSCGALNRDEQR